MANGDFRGDDGWDEGCRSGRALGVSGVMGHYTLNHENNRYIGDIKIHNEEFDETYYGFENHQCNGYFLD